MQFKVINLSKDSELVSKIGSVLNNFDFKDTGFVNLSTNNECKTFIAFHYGKTKDGTPSTRYSEQLKFISTESIKLALSIDPELKFNDEIYPQIDISSYQAPAVHEIVSSHIDSDNYGKCCTIIFYYQVDNTIVDGGIELFINEEKHLIDTRSTSNEIKVLFMNDSVEHMVQPINGEGKRMVLAVFLSLL